MERILITGAGGYIGSNAAVYFAQKGYTVTGMVHRNICERFSSSGTEAVQAELGEPGSLDALFTSHKYDYVLHIAALASDVGRDEDFRIANFEAVKQLAYLSLRHGVKRFVYLSTADVYGLKDFHGETEEQLPFDDNVTNPYPKYKIQSEQWLAENLPPERFACVRPCVVFGNGDTTITPRTVSYLRTSPFVFHFGKWKGQNRWPLAHVENVCRTLHAAMLLPEAGGKGVTVLDSRRTTLSEYYRQLAQEYLPGRHIREASIPKWVIWPFACLSTAISRRKPLFDPTLYALDTISHNLDFSNSRMLKWLKAAKLEEYISDSYR
ncbi:MAG: NAD(P)-dependent oxidoreductase [Victivallales bacterium]|nr:NAD(P)-dependent oxidoreductase [Victivallales bacterium]